METPLKIVCATCQLKSGKFLIPYFCIYNDFQVENNAASLFFTPKAMKTYIEKYFST